MYNETKKQAYLDYLREENYTDQVIKRYAYFFERIAPEEEMFDTDLEEIDKACIYRCIQKEGYLNEKSASTFVNCVNGYRMWCKGLAGRRKAPPGLLVSTTEVDFTDAFLRSLVMCQADLEKIIKSTVMSEYTVAPVIACLAWMGFSPAQIAELQIEDFHYVDSEPYIKNVLVPDGYVRDTIVEYMKTDAVGEYVKMTSNQLLRRYSKVKAEENFTSRKIQFHYIFALSNVDNEKNVSTLGLGFAGKMERLYDAWMENGCVDLKPYQIAELFDIDFNKSIASYQKAFEFYKMAVIIYENTKGPRKKRI